MSYDRDTLNSVDVNLPDLRKNHKRKRQDPKDVLVSILYVNGHTVTHELRKLRAVDITPDNRMDAPWPVGIIEKGYAGTIWTESNLKMAMMDTDRETHHITYTYDSAREITVCRLTVDDLEYGPMDMPVRHMVKGKTEEFKLRHELKAFNGEVQMTYEFSDAGVKVMAGPYDKGLDATPQLCAQFQLMYLGEGTDPMVYWHPFRDQFMDRPARVISSSESGPQEFKNVITRARILPGKMDLKDLKGLGKKVMHPFRHDKVDMITMPGLSPNFDDDSGFDRSTLQDEVETGNSLDAEMASTASEPEVPVEAPRSEFPPSPTTALMELLYRHENPSLLFNDYQSEAETEEAASVGENETIMSEGKTDNSSEDSDVVATNTSDFIREDSPEGSWVTTADGSLESEGRLSSQGVMEADRNRMAVSPSYSDEVSLGEALKDYEKWMNRMPLQ